MGGNDNAERTVELLVTDTEARLREARSGITKP